LKLKFLRMRWGRIMQTTGHRKGRRNYKSIEYNDQIYSYNGLARHVGIPESSFRNYINRFLKQYKRLPDTKEIDIIVINAGELIGRPIKPVKKSMSVKDRHNELTELMKKF